ncbi:proteinase inhibitor I78 [Streptomyces sp. E11-3]|uniref:proteinase inhibitor I78 n=1 Tax=Streptomyces sp. E11-3 TaxID=3110112 RepID=UPI0039815636
MAPIPTPPTAPQDVPEAYVGLAAADAERRARTRGWSVVRAVPPGAFITMEFLEGRINFEVSDDIVTRCWQG